MHAGQSWNSPQSLWCPSILMVPVCTTHLLVLVARMIQSVRLSRLLPFVPPTSAFPSFSQCSIILPLLCSCCGCWEELYFSHLAIILPLQSSLSAHCLAQRALRWTSHPNFVPETCYYFPHYFTQSRTRYSGFHISVCLFLMFFNLWGQLS